MTIKKVSDQIDLGQVGTIAEGLLYTYSALVAGLDIQVIEPGQKTLGGKLVPEGRAGIVIERGDEHQMSTFWKTYEAMSGRSLVEAENVKSCHIPEIITNETISIKDNLREEFSNKYGKEQNN